VAVQNGKAGMSVWIVFTEAGEYEQYSRDLEGVFATEELAQAFALVVSGEVEEHPVLNSAPVLVDQFEWSDYVAPDGKLSPERLFGRTVYRSFGRSRRTWQIWDHQAIDLRSEVTDWDGRKSPSQYVRVEGRGKEQVKAEHHRLVAQVRAEQKSAV